MIKLIVSDLDGTLFNNEHRRHLVPTGDAAAKTEGWAEFNKACGGDSPISVMHTLICTMFRPFFARDARDWPIVSYVTGRGRQSLSETTKQLQSEFDRSNGFPAKYKLPSGSLYMRPANDHGTPTEAKGKLFAEAVLHSVDAINWPHNCKAAKEAQSRFFEGEGIVFLEDDHRIIEFIRAEYPRAVVIAAPVVTNLCG